MKRIRKHAVVHAGMNLVFGVGATKGDVRPYGQMKVVVSNDTQAVLGAGIRF